MEWRELGERGRGVDSLREREGGRKRCRRRGKENGRGEGKGIAKEICRGSKEPEAGDREANEIWGEGDRRGRGRVERVSKDGEADWMRKM